MPRKLRCELKQRSVSKSSEITFVDADLETVASRLKFAAPLSLRPYFDSVSSSTIIPFLLGEDGASSRLTMTTKEFLTF
ncbi:hypothetical protein EON65_59075 [archaeon]|nr:MAG: hypothetical protein EON65_59075 [archaeon]